MVPFGVWDCRRRKNSVLTRLTAFECGFQRSVARVFLFAAIHAVRQMVRLVDRHFAAVNHASHTYTKRPLLSFTGVVHLKYKDWNIWLSHLGFILIAVHINGTKIRGSQWASYIFTLSIVQTIGFHIDETLIKVWSPEKLSLMRVVYNNGGPNNWVWLYCHGWIGSQAGSLV